MSDIVVRVEHVGKRYAIGGRQDTYPTLRQKLASAAGMALRWIHGGRQKVEHIWALTDVSFEVRQGDALGIIGRNGAGKSTLLKILSRITKPTRGRVELYGRVGSLLEVGTGFHPELTGRENIYLNAAILGMRRAEIKRKYNEIVDFAAIGNFQDTPVKHYSSGMYVRLAFAVAAHFESEILIVDEVLAVGDAEFQKKCLGKMGDAARGGRTVLFVSHNMGAIESFCQQSILLESGSVVCRGNTRDVVDAYLSAGYRDLDMPLGDRKDRVGTGKLRFKSIILEDKKIRKRLLQIDFFIQNLIKQKFDNVLLSIVIFDHLGMPISNLVNYIVDKPIFIDSEGSAVRVKIRNLSLVPGSYYLSVFISSDNQNSEIYDYVTNAAKFEVPDYDYYQKGYSPYIKGRVVYMDYDFQNL